MTIVLSGSVGNAGDNNQDDVTIVQTLMDGIPIEQGGPNPKLVVDGLNGQNTIAAIREFQRQHGMSDSGRIEPGDNTFNRLLSESRYVAATVIGSPVGENAPQGNLRPDVRKVQTLLNAVPADQGGPNPRLAPDGLIGPKTINAITEFQQRQALSEVGGRIDPGGATLARLNDISQLSLIAHLALRILENNRITLSNSHLSGVDDKATVQQNIVDTSDGQPAARSNYENAPGGTVRLRAPILNLYAKY